VGSSWVTSLSCLYIGYPVRNLSFITTQAKGITFVRLKLSVWASQSDTQLAFHNVSKGGRYYRAKKKKYIYIREDLILPELLWDNVSDVPDDIFQ
jgi:hypothetical protein